MKQENKRTAVAMCLFNVAMRTRNERMRRTRDNRC